MRGRDHLGREAEAGTVLSEGQLRKEAQRVLGRLCEISAVMAVAPEMDKAVVVREDANGTTTRRAVVDREVAEALALKNWISCNMPGRISRYHITRAGRTTLSRLLAEAENHAVGFAEAPVPFRHATNAPHFQPAPTVQEDEQRYVSTETPLALLARRRDRSGKKFLPTELVAVGERLREDFEMAALRPQCDEGWDRFLTASEGMAPPVGASSGSAIARRRVIGALRDLGPGLGDIALRCCCYLEGLESTEKRMGWSARSGKVVLRIALQRLKRHYDGLGDAGALLG